MSQSSLSRAYDPAEVEKKWYSTWEERGYFHADPQSDKPAYSIVIPPPNVTGMLTLGHVLNNSLQDILIRFEKLRGREVCWVPGTDHAGIATQAKVEAQLRQEKGLGRHDLGREKFLEHMWQWKEKYGGTIIRQLRSIGCACDWERERFTLDPKLSAAVQEVFIRLYNKGLVYKGKRIINWCPKSGTALSDEEVIYREEKGKLWYFRYPYSDGSGYVVIATTRPETMLADTAVAVHPEDARYRDKLGKTLTLPLVGREIPLIADDYVEREFGSGAVKITPAHDPNDYEVGLRHGLDMPEVMNDDGTMNKQAGADFDGLDRYQARKLVLQKMEELGLLEKTEEHIHQVGYSERGNVAVEPRLSDQWFVKMEELAKPALEVVEQERVRFHPQRWVKTYRHWMENIKDWCISRQLWWGHRIPAYYCTQCNKLYVSKESPALCVCGCKAFKQDPDVLDTWFSSWLWPFSVFDWPEESRELKRFYPTQSLVTGPDIIFFWVARMIMAGLEFTGDIPFSDVYFTSIIRDEEGRKMSKSLNNSPDPIDVVAQYGADALRFTMAYIAPLGQDIRYSNEKCELGRNFANKLWNLVRFRLSKGAVSSDWQDLEGLPAERLRADDKWILARLQRIVKATGESLQRFSFNEAARNLYDFIWNEFCDWYLESCKSAFEGDCAGAAASRRIFDHAVSVFLRLLHPFMPFVTEELYHQMGFVGPEDSIMLSKWPEEISAEQLEQLGANEELLRLNVAKFELIRALRNLRASYQIPGSRAVSLVIEAVSREAEEFLRDDLDALQSLLNAESIEFAARPEGACGVALSDIGSAYLPLAGVVDLEAELARLRKQEEESSNYLAGLQSKLANANFVARAPEAVVAKERQNVRDTEEKLSRIREQIAVFGQ
ncbi:MAG: valine--tRNA ligase [Lentisphaeria bacterium]|nr:valine--tRNA ligase [Lentisphaeria bacterium]MDY0176309.1 valine--tRNA ligase [Lentisphaeria bacterium]